MSKPWFRRKNSGNNKKTNSNFNPSLIENLPDYGYSGFKLYFPDQSNINIETLKINISAFLKFIEENQASYSIEDIIKNEYFIVDYRLLITNEDLFEDWKNLKTDILDNSEYCLNCMGLAMHQFLESSRKNIDKDLDDIPLVHPRISNLEPILQLKDLRVNYYGKLVTIRGTVIRSGHVKCICQYLTFTCCICQGTQLVKQVDGAYTLPLKCPTKGCRAQSNFIPEFSSPYNIIIKWEAIKIQELIGTEQCENARVPRTLDCELTADLVKTCLPGDDVTITGIIKVRDPNSNYGKNKQNTVFSLYLEGISTFSNRVESKTGGNPSKGITFNENDYNLINKICLTPNLFKLLVHSLCPNIYGHEIIKAGLLLALFGGTKSDIFRAESHVLVVGDPGLGKSQMLQACSNVAPRGIYVCGNTSTSSGLTVTLTRDGSEFALEAGALMLADQGCCCIDEFDKMPSQHACLLEAMEQQSISIAKGGIVCTIPTRTTILSAANPAGGHYNKAKTIAENLKISSPMLSRFDLIFILLDQPNEQLDLLLSKHILGLHMLGTKPRNDDSLNYSDATECQEMLRDRLKANGEVIDHLPHILFRKYIAYAQKYVHPYLSEEANKVLKTFYFSLRKQFQTGDSTPVTTRQLNSLIRLTQARAKAELREEATKQDALDVIEIMKFSLIDIFTDNCGVLDKTRSQNGTGTSSKRQAMKLLKILQRRSDIETKSMFELNEIKQLAEHVGISKDKIYDIVQGLNLQGFLLNKGQSRYQLRTADI